MEEVPGWLERTELSVLVERFLSLLRVGTPEAGSADKTDQKIESASAGSPDDWSKACFKYD